MRYEYAGAIKTVLASKNKRRVAQFAIAMKALKSVCLDPINYKLTVCNLCVQHAILHSRMKPLGVTFQNVRMSKMNK